MKIEKVNENQIRCTLTKEDLASRQLKASELAYGTEKAKNLFRDMMQQANFEFGFEAEDIPLMIEAIPLNSECIVLIITKVEDPEELDTRFSRFAPSVHEEAEKVTYEEEDYLDSEDVMDLFRRLHESRHSSAGTNHNKLEEFSETASNQTLTRIFLFSSLDSVLSAAKLLNNSFMGKSSLYKETQSSQYSLVLTLGDMDVKSFNKISNILSEYGRIQKVTPASFSYLKEHYEEILAENAISSLAKI